VAFDSAIEKHADSKCCNVSRFFFFVPTEMFYVNYDSETINEVVTPVYVPNCFVQQLQLSNYEDKDLIRKGCVEMMNRKRIFFTFGNRANYIFSLARTMTEHGLSRYEILNHCNSLAEPNSPGRQQFTTKEIERQVDFGIKRATNQFTVNQLKKYLKW
jgi:hypothetical protein